MNSANVLALIADLYGQIVALQNENADLRKQLSSNGDKSDLERVAGVPSP